MYFRANKHVLGPANYSKYKNYDYIYLSIVDKASVIGLGQNLW